MVDCKYASLMPFFGHEHHAYVNVRREIEHCVFSLPATDGAGRKPVIVLHELFGLSAECRGFAERLYADGFAVYLPTLFGTPLPRSGLGGAINAARMCIGREFTLLRRNKTSPVTKFVRSLSRAVAKRHEGNRVAVIGMCLTAHVVFPLTYDPTVGAVVSAQSAMPWTTRPLNTAGRRKSLAIGASDIASIKQADDPADVMAIRFASDPISPEERMDSIRQLFSQPVCKTLEDPVTLRPPSPFRPHSTMTAEFDPHPEAHTAKAYDEIVSFLRSSMDEH